MKSRVLSVVATLIVALIGMSILMPVVEARAQNRTAFEALYPWAGDPGGLVDLYNCGVCHTATNGGGPRNAYGADLEAAGLIGNLNPSQRRAIIASIEASDSDGDGYDNITEITANSQPGDAADVPASVPDAPTAAAATQGDTEASVTWTAPASDGGSPVTSYTVTAYFEGGTASGQTATTPDGATLSVTVTGLANGTSYTFTVLATNAIGNSAESAQSNAVTPVAPTAPDPPTGSSATPGDTEAIITWTAPASDGGSAITSYTVTAYFDGAGPSGQTATTPDGSTLNATVTGLANGTAYTFTVFATNIAGNSTESAQSNAVTPFAPIAPDAPTGPVATQGDTEASVTWTAPASDGGSAITSYTVTAYFEGGAASGQTATTPDGSTLTATVTGLTNSTAYTFTVFATNAIGNGVESVQSNAVTPAAPTAPDAPTAPIASPGDTEATVTWSAPAFDGGSAITSYTVTAYFEGGAASGQTATTPDGATLNATVTGLTNDTAYTFTVFATNAIGDSAESTQSNAVTPFVPTAPDAPTGPAAIQGDTEATVTWAAPAFDGGSPITSYTVTAYFDGAGPSGQTATTPDGATLSATVAGLANGTAYTFTVLATNAVGDSTESTQSNAVTPAPLTAPDAPTGALATAGDTEATVSWTAPVLDGGSPITSYTVTAYFDGAGPSGQTATTPDGATFSATVTGLTNGTAYTFTVFATNAIGSGAESTQSNAITAGTVPGQPLSAVAVADNRVPAAPTSVLASPRDTQANVAWVAPIFDGASPITSYTVTAYSGAVATGQTVTTPDGSTFAATVTGLTNGTAYTFKVHATNAFASGPRSSHSNAVTASATATATIAPVATIASPRDGEAIVSWTAPTSDGGSPVTSYTVVAYEDGGPATGDTETTPDGSTLTATVTGLTNGTAYTFTVFATNAAGDSSESAQSNVVTPALAAAIPDTAPVVTAVAGDGDATVTWSASPSDGGSAITSYTVTAYYNGAGPSGQTAITPDGTTLTATITGLTNATSYTFTVFATNAIGDSVESAQSSAVTPTDTPVYATVTWSAPLSDGGNPILMYTVTAYFEGAGPSGQTASTLDSETFAVAVPGLTIGTPYTFTVHATNIRGNGAESAQSNALTVATVPNPPLSAAATPGNTEATVTWSAPASDGGSTILAYTVTAYFEGAGPSGETAIVDGVTFVATVTGLTNGTAYTFTIYATNAEGAGSESAQSNAVTPGTPPTAPLTPSAVAGNTEATVTWSAPASDGGNPVTSYTVTAYFEGAGPSGETAVTPDGTTLNATVTGLTNDTAYTFTVIATNTIGAGPESAQSNAITPSTAIVAPGAPTNAAATPGTAEATVTWDAPASDGGSPITSYTVTAYFEGAGPSGETVTTPDGATLTATVTGLTNGTAYTFTVLATNVAGSSPESVQSNAITPGLPPDPPTNAIATAGNSEVFVTWTAPLSDGGSPITSYTVTSSPEGLTATTPDGATLTALVTGLTNSTAYTFTVVATNTNGDGLPSTASNSVTPAAVAGPPLTLAAVPGNTEAQVTWTAPASDGGSPITSYTVTSNPGGFTATTPDGTTLVALVTGLTNGIPYTFTAVATNANGDSLPSAPSNAATPDALPGSPTNIVVTPGDTEATVTWDAPVSDGGSPITSYTATSSPEDLTATTPDGATLELVVTGLTNSVEYTFTVFASNANGDSLSSVTSNPATPALPPNEPTNVAASAAHARATVSWTASTDDGGNAITSYTVISSPDGLTATTLDGVTTAAIVMGLRNSVAYTFTVSATNEIGSSTASIASNVATPDVAWPATPLVQPPAHNFHAPYSGDTSSCAACHRVHTAPASVAVQSAWPEEAVCLTCHDGTAASNIDAQYAKTYRMPVAETSGIHSMSEARDQNAAAFAGANRHVECQDCHNPHLAGQGTHPAGSSYAYGTEQGAWGLAATNTAAWTSPALTATYPITSQYEGCLKCHSSWAYGGSPPLSPSGGYTQTDQAIEFNTLNPSFHPVEDVGRNPYVTWDGTSYASSLIGGFTPTSRMTCSDCHGSETPGDPAGTHGSTEPFILTGGWDRTTGQTGTETDLCFSCHAFGTYGQGASVAAPTGFSERTTTNNLHGFHVGIANPDYGAQAIGCMDCHAAVPHGFNRDGLIALTSDPAPYVDRPYSGGLIAIETWEASGAWEIASCATSCHPP